MEQAIKSLSSEYFCNEPLKEVLFQIYYTANRHDTKQLVLDGLVIFFERAYDEHQAQVDDDDDESDYETLADIVTEIRTKLITDYTVWRQRQWYALFMEKLFIRLAPKCPAHVLLALFADDLLELGNEEIVLLRQLFPRILKNLNAGYLNSSDCTLISKEIFSSLLLRLTNLAFEDSDAEIRSLALETFAKFEESEA